MEDIKAYIESGILELYVMGDVSPGERLQVEEMAAKHPAIKAELDEIGRAMEDYALNNAIDPPAHLRERTLNSLVTNLADDANFPTKTETIKGKVITMPAPKVNNFYKFAFAACLVLLILSVVALININNQLSDANLKLVALNSANQQYAKTVSFKDEQLNVFHDSTFRFIKLKGTDKAPDASMVVAFNPIKKKVMIDMAGLKMPKNDKDHQYQLWAIVDKKPVSLGVFDKTGSDTTDMKIMKSVASAQAFAVTLEPRGGSINPTMDEMMVIGTF